MGLIGQNLLVYKSQPLGLQDLLVLITFWINFSVTSARLRPSTGVAGTLLTVVKTVNKPTGPGNTRSSARDPTAKDNSLISCQAFKHIFGQLTETHSISHTKFCQLFDHSTNSSVLCMQMQNQVFLIYFGLTFCVNWIPSFSPQIWVLCKLWWANVLLTTFPG